MPAPSRILVTGAHGFVGSHLVPRLRVAFPDAEIATPRATALDVTDAASVDAAVAAFCPDACVHLAAIAAIPAARRDPDLAWRVNLFGTLAVAEALFRHVPDCVLLYPSSADAYGKSFLSGMPLDETAQLAPTNIYGATKAAAEMALSALAVEGLRVIVLRPFNHTGPGQTADFVVPGFARQVARIEIGLQPAVIRVGRLDSRRDFLDVDDVCGAYIAALSRAETLAPGTILNIASGTARRVGDILDEVIALSSTLPKVETSEALFRAFDIPIAVGNSATARSTLNWSPKTAWKTTLEKILDYWRAGARDEASAPRH